MIFIVFTFAVAFVFSPTQAGPIDLIDSLAEHRYPGGLGTHDIVKKGMYLKVFYDYYQSIPKTRGWHIRLVIVVNAIYYGNDVGMNPIPYLREGKLKPGLDSM